MILWIFFFNICDIFIWLQLTYRSSNWLLLFAIDFWCLQLSLLKAHDSLEVKWIGKIYRIFIENFPQFTFSLQFTLVNCTWSGPYTTKYVVVLQGMKTPKMTIIFIRYAWHPFLGKFEGQKFFATLIYSLNILTNINIVLCTLHLVDMNSSEQFWAFGTYLELQH